MEKLLTDKTHLIVLTNNMRIWITEKEYETVDRLLELGKSFIKVSDSIINTNTILYVGSRGNIDEADKIKRGEWKCELGFWHERNQQCGHNKNDLEG